MIKKSNDTILWVLFYGALLFAAALLNSCSLVKFSTGNGTRLRTDSTVRIDTVYTQSGIKIDSLKSVIDSLNEDFAEDVNSIFDDLPDHIPDTGKMVYWRNKAFELRDRVKSTQEENKGLKSLVNDLYEKYKYALEHPTVITKTITKTSQEDSSKWGAIGGAIGLIIGQLLSMFKRKK